jgi:hypothetical protein
MYHFIHGTYSMIGNIIIGTYSNVTRSSMSQYPNEDFTMGSIDNARSGLRTGPRLRGERAQGVAVAGPRSQRWTKSVMATWNNWTEFRVKEMLQEVSLAIQLSNIHILNLAGLFEIFPHIYISLFWQEREPFLSRYTKIRPPTATIKNQPELPRDQKNHPVSR